MPDFSAVQLRYGLGHPHHVNIGCVCPEGCWRGRSPLSGVIVVVEQQRPAWQGSDRRSRLPANWKSELRPRALELNPDQICHKCGLPGGTTLDHKQRGDKICLNPAMHDAKCQCNLDWIHDRQDVRKGRSAVNCHGQKTSREGAAARQPRNRPPERHPAFG